MGAFELRNGRSEKTYRVFQLQQNLRLGDLLDEHLRLFFAYRGADESTNFYGKMLETRQLQERRRQVIDAAIALSAREKGSAHVDGADGLSVDICDLRDEFVQAVLGTQVEADIGVEGLCNLLIELAGDFVLGRSNLTRWSDAISIVVGCRWSLAERGGKLGSAF